MKKIMLMAVVAFLGISIISAQPGQFRRNNMGGRGFGPGPRGDCTQMLPNLTEDQKEAILDLRVEYLKETQDNRNELAVLRAEYKSLVSSSSPDSEAIDNNIDSQTDIINENMKMRTDHRMQVRDLLTDEQKVLFDNRPGRKGMGMNCRRNRQFMGQ